MARLWSTLALLAVLAGLGAYIYFGLPKESDTASSTSKQEKVFVSLASDKIDELKVKSESGDVTTVKKVANAWQVTDPIASTAADTEVSGITMALGNLEITRVIDEKPADLKQYGLDPARIEVDFKAEDGKSTGRLMIGQKTATSGGLYARRNDDPRVFLISTYQDTTFNKTTFDLRDKSIVSFQRDKVDSMEVSADGKALSFAKEGSDWKLTKPLAARADSSAVEGLLGRVANAQMKSVAASDVAAADLKKYGLDKPASVTVGAGSARATLLVGGKADDDNVYARDASKPAVVTVEKALADELKKGVDDYRRRDVFEFRAYSATHVEFTRNGQTIVFERVKGQGDTPDKWRRVSPNAADVDKSKMENLLAGLADMRITAFSDSTAKSGLDQPALVVNAKFEDGKKEERVSFGKSGNDVNALRSNDPGAGKIESERFEEALKQLDELSK